MPSPLEILKNGFAEWDRSKGANKDLWIELSTDNVRFGSTGDGGIGADFRNALRGKAAFREYLDGLTGAYQMQNFIVNNWIDGGDKVAAIGQTEWTHKETGKSFVTPIVVTAEFEDGKISSLFQYYDTAMVNAAATPDT